ncbi:MAG: AAA family ATPase [Sulfuritalea sp.]|nr:AAA family ATPase [Sulfuritalea sp.]
MTAENLIFAPTLPAAFALAGLPFPDKPPTPGKLSRFSTGDRADDLAGWCKVFPDTVGAVFGDWRSGENFTWQQAKTDAPPPTAEQRAAARAKADAVRREAEAERTQQHAKAAARAAKIFSELPPLTEHPYCKRKGIAPTGARLDADGALALPVYDEAGSIQSLQFIDPKGGKRFMPGGKMAGGRLYLGKPADGSPLLICEGWATGASLHNASGITVACAFSGSNLKNVAADLRARFPRSPIVVAGDLDEHGAGLRYGEAAKAACEPSGLILPLFADDRAAGDFNDLAASDGISAVKRRIQTALNPPSRYKLLTDADLAALPPLRWRIKGILPECGLAALFGASGSGKSFLVLDMAQALAAGADWFEHRAKACPVVYVALEGEAGIAGRVAAYRIRHGKTAGGIRYLTQPFSLLERGDIHALADAIQAAGGAGVVVLDTLNRAAPGADENDSKSMGAILGASKELQRLVGGLVLLVHHSGKDSSKGLRGHSSLHAALDAAIEVRRDGDRREWILAKSKDGADGDAHPFKLEIVELGTDEDGEPITSCIVKPEQHTAESVRRALPPKAGNLKIAWDAIGEALRKAGDGRPADAPASLPHGRPCLLVESALPLIGARLAVEPKRRTERARLALTNLCAKGMIHLEDGFLWTT